MLNKLLFASLLALGTTTTSHAAPVARLPIMIPTDVCVAGKLGTPLWEIDMRADVADLPTSTITVSTTGSWTLVQRDHGKVTRQASGCMGTDPVAKLTRILASATWKSSAQKYRCMAMSASYTVYSYKGKQVMVSRTCDGLTWDQKTSEAIARATELTNVFALTGVKPEPPQYDFHGQP